MKKGTTISIIFMMIVSLAVAQKKKNDLTEMNLNGKIKSTREILYEASGNSSEINKKNIIDSNRMFFNDKGNKIEETEYKSDGKIDEKGNKIETTSYFKNGKVSSKYIFNYDIKGNETEFNNYNFEGKLVEKRVYKYDDKRKRIEAERNLYNPDESLRTKSISKYNSNGDCSEINYYNSDGSLGSKIKYVYDYDINSNIIKQIVFGQDGRFRIKERVILYF